MRTRLLISAVAVLAACSEDRGLTSPATGLSAVPPTTADVAPAVVVQAAGKPSTPAFSSIVTVVGNTRNVLGDPGNMQAVSVATCPAGYLAIGGAFNITNGAKHLRVMSSKPNDAGTAWTISGAWFGDLYDYSDYGAFAAIAICIK